MFGATGEGAGRRFSFSCLRRHEHIPVIEVEFVHLAGLESYPVS